MEKVNILEKFNKINTFSQPGIVGELNGQYVKLVKHKGKFVMHKHTNEDELFMVIKGNMQIELKDEIIDLTEGEFFIVPRGMEHRPISKEIVYILLFEPKTTLNTGNKIDDATVTDLKWI